MKLSDGPEKGISKFTRKVWESNPHAFVTIDLLDNGFMGPWATIHDIGGFEKKILVMDIDDNEYIPYVEVRDGS